MPTLRTTSLSVRPGRGTPRLRARRRRSRARLARGAPRRGLGDVSAVPPLAGEVREEPTTPTERRDGLFGRGWAPFRVEVVDQNGLVFEEVDGHVDLSGRRSAGCAFRPPGGMSVTIGCPRDRVVRRAVAWLAERPAANWLAPGAFGEETPSGPSAAPATVAKSVPKMTAVGQATSGGRRAGPMIAEIGQPSVASTAPTPGPAIAAWRSGPARAVVSSAHA